MLLFILVLLIGCDTPGTPEKTYIVGEAQGTYYTVTYYSSDQRNYQSSIDSILREFDQTASLWVKNSMINRVNNNEAVTVNKTFVDLFRISQEVSELTNGYFDITVGPLVNAWGFGVDNKPEIKPGSVDSLLPLVNFKNVWIRNQELIKSDPGIKLDFNAVAQGYSVDLVSGFLESKGIENYLVDIGGEVYAYGTKPDGKPWRVGIEKPSEEQSSPREMEAELTLAGQAVATSGNYRKYYEKDGVRYSHTIDPHTGYPVRHSLLSVSVVADSCAYADAYATAFMAMGIKEALKLIDDKQLDMEVYFIYSDQDGVLKTLMTEGLKESLVEDK